MAHHLKLPKYVKAYQRRGAWFYYYRRHGFQALRLPGEPWSEAFMAAYALALAGEAPRLSVGAGRAPAGSATAAILAYLASAGTPESFDAIKSQETKRVHRGTLERLSAKIGEDGKRIGDQPFRLLDKRITSRRVFCCRRWRNELKLGDLTPSTNLAF